MHLQHAWFISNDVTVWEENVSVSHTGAERCQLPLSGKRDCVNTLGKPLWVNTACLQVIAPLFTFNKACQLLPRTPVIQPECHKTTASWCHDVMALRGLSRLPVAEQSDINGESCTRRAECDMSHLVQKQQPAGRLDAWVKENEPLFPPIGRYGTYEHSEGEPLREQFVPPATAKNTECSSRSPRNACK